MNEFDWTTFFGLFLLVWIILFIWFMHSSYHEEEKEPDMGAGPIQFDGVIYLSLTPGGGGIHKTTYSFPSNDGDDWVRVDLYTTKDGTICSNVERVEFDTIPDCEG